MAVLGVTLMAGCGFVGGEESTVPLASTQITPTARTSTPVPTPTPTATPRPSPTPRPLAQFLSTPSPTPAPATSLSTAEVTQLVYLEVRECADQLGAAGNKLELSLTSDYSSEERKWRVGVTGAEGTLTFGQYHVTDDTGTVAPADATSSRLLEAGVVCSEPASVLSKGPVPPQMSIISSLPPVPVPAIGSKNQAEMEVWLKAYSCYGTFPELGNFFAYEYGAGKWIVEGKSDATQFGLWQVDAMSGLVSPLDRLAIDAAAECSLSTAPNYPSTVQGPQAELRVWIAVYDCFGQPERSSFRFYTDNPQRWLVEGRREAVYAEETGLLLQAGALFGLWVVDAVNGEVKPWDDRAQATAADVSCYRTP